MQFLAIQLLIIVESANDFMPREPKVDQPIPLFEFSSVFSPQLPQYTDQLINFITNS